MLATYADFFRSVNRLWLAMALAAAWLAVPASAQIVTWTGGSGSGSNWNDSANWSALPSVTTSGLVFAGTQRTASSNNLVTTATSILFSNDGTSGRTGAFTLSGSAITLGGNINATAINTGSGGIALSDTIALDMVLNNNRTLTLGQGHDLTISGLVSGATRNLNKAGDAMLTLTNTANSFSQLVINNGTVKVTQIGTAGSPSQTGTAVTINMGFSTSTGSILYVGSAGSPEVTNKRIQIGTIAGSSGNATLISDGGNAIQFTNSQFNTLQGAATAPRTLTLSGSNTGDNLIGGTIADNAALAPISVTKSGAGRWILSGTNTFTGQTSVSAGTLVVRGGSALVDTGTVAVSGGTFQLDSSETIGRLDLTGAGMVAVTSGSTATLTAATYAASLTSGTATISAPLAGGATGFTMSGSGGTVVLSSSNAYSGSTTLSAGILKAGHVNAFSTGGITVANGATLDLNSLAVANGITNNGGTVSNASSYAGSQTLSGTSTFGAVGGTLVVANGGAATFGGALAAATTIDAGGNGTLTDAGSITATSLANNGTFTISRTGSSSVATAFSGNGTLVKAGAGVVTLSGSSSISGPTQVNAGDLRVNGSLAGGVSVAAAGLLGGSGSVGAISGAGIVGPGNSPGILTSTGSLDGSSGIDFAFELTGTAPTWSTATASVNDVLHLTAATPMTAALSGSNTINVYLNAGSLTAGNTYLGGIFIDQPQATLDLSSLVSSATVAYFVAGGSDVTYNGVGYFTFANYVASNPGVTGIDRSTATVSSADFSTGTVTNGQTMQFVIVPEPGALLFVATGAIAAGWSACRTRCRRPR